MHLSYVEIKNKKPTIMFKNEEEEEEYMPAIFMFWFSTEII